MRNSVLSRVGAGAAVGVLAAASLATPAPSSAVPSNIAGRIVFLDPGHNGGNDSAYLSQQVPNGRGGTKDCQTSGTASGSGYAEHTFAWETTLLVRQMLTKYGVRTALSRGEDNGRGPCVNERAERANGMRPDAIVSIHADGGPADARGFHVNYSAPPLNDSQSGGSVKLAHAMRDQLQAAGIPPASYIGENGLKGRSDLAGLNLAQYPAVLVELGNMKNATDAQLMETPAGRQKYAEAVTRGVVSYLGGQLPAAPQQPVPQPAPAPAPPPGEAPPPLPPPPPPPLPVP